MSQFQWLGNTVIAKWLRIDVFKIRRLKEKSEHGFVIFNTVSSFFKL